MPRPDFNSLALGTRLASGLGRAHQKYVFVPYRELAYVIHVGSAQEAIKKKGYFKSFEDHSDDYSKKSKKVKELKNQLVALKEALAAQPKDPKESTVEATSKSSAALRAETNADLKIALEAVAETVTQRDKAAADMFQLYVNLLSVNAR